MTQPTKYLLGLTGVLLFSLYFQSSIDSPASSSKVLSLQLLGSKKRGLELELVEGTIGPRRPEVRKPIRTDEFWLTESDYAYLPFEINFVPPDESYGKLEHVWSCHDPNVTSTVGRSKKLVFVHPVRTEADLITDLLSSYATSCHAGYASTLMCSGLSWESMISGTWANRRAPGKKNGVRCYLQEAKNRDGSPIQDTKFIESSFLTKHIDTLVGQIPLGSHQQWKDNNKEIVEAQYVVSLRCPYAWFISSMIDKVKSEQQQQGDDMSVEDVVKEIEKKVEDDLANELFHEVYARYLITPSQISWIKREGADLDVKHRAGLALRNLVDNKAVIVIKEKMVDSLELVQYIIDADGVQEKIFAEAKQQLQRQIDEEKASSPSVEQVREKLKADSSLYKKLQTYLKYEAEIYNHAKDLQKQQLAWLRENRPAPIIKTND